MIDPALQVYMDAHNHTHQAEAAEIRSIYEEARRARRETNTIIKDAIEERRTDTKAANERMTAIERASENRDRSLQTTLDTLVFHNGGPRNRSRKAWLVHQAAGGVPTAVPTAGILGIVYAIARAVGVG